MPDTPPGLCPRMLSPAPPRTMGQEQEQEQEQGEGVAGVGRD